MKEDEVEKKIYWDERRCSNKQRREKQNSDLIAKREKKFSHINYTKVVTGDKKMWTNIYTRKK